MFGGALSLFYYYLIQFLTSSLVSQLSANEVEFLYMSSSLSCNLYFIPTLIIKVILYFVTQDSVVLVVQTEYRKNECKV